MIVMSDRCMCWNCMHPNDDNAGERVLHDIRHREFAESLAAFSDVELGRLVAMRELILETPDTGDTEAAE